MIDPRREAVLIIDRTTGQVDETKLNVENYVRRAGGRIGIVFSGSSKEYPYGGDRVRILSRSEGLHLEPGQRIEVDGVVWEGAAEVWTFRGDGGAWSRVFYPTARGESNSLRPAAAVQIVSDAAGTPQVAGVVRYLHDLVSKLGDDPFKPVYKSLTFVHPESALARYCAGAPIESRELETDPIYPFRCNLSQRQAVEYALTHSVSVIKGPPGTGKTETILNLIANILAAGTATVGVVSYGNSAVDNVRDKLDELGFGHVIARLGRRELVQEFFEQQDRRNAAVTEFVNSTPPEPPRARLAEVDRRLRRLQTAERDRAQLRQEIDAHSLELRHFEKHVEPGDLSQLDRLPLLRRSSDRILDYLVETELERERPPGLVRRIRKYLKYGSLRGLDPEDTAVVLRLQRAFYDSRIAELTKRLAQVEADLDQAGFADLVREHQRLSADTLHAVLGARYRSSKRKTYRSETYRGKDARDFAADYPVVLSTCHSLRNNLPGGLLLDYLIIDEASQVDLLAAGAALASCRNLVVVGDLKQLPHLPNEAVREVVAPHAAYDYNRYSILASLGEVYSQHLPQTQLREHYRCDPAIIGFCNKSFYAGELIPFTQSTGTPSMLVRRTVEGNHMRQYSGGGRTNQREVDVVLEEVIPQDCAGVPSSEIGITTPYRRQADKVTQALIEKVDADTVHSFQGRQKEVIVMTTVLDETWRGQTGLKFVDDPKLVNVAVSRAAKKFILVTNHARLSKSRNLRDLIDYIDYQRLDDGVIDSAVISVFDLLYREYSDRLRALADRLHGDSRWRSENIIWTVLHDILAEEAYQHLTVSSQVLLRNLLPDAGRLTAEQAKFVANRASVDFVVYNRVSNRPLLAVEVDGFASHENNPVQLRRDDLKNQILESYDLRLLRLPTTGSGEEQRIRTELDQAEI